MIVGSVLPIMVMATLVILTYYHREQAQVSADTVARARAVTSAVDREFGTVQAALLALSTSRRLLEDDLAGFHAQALVAVSNLNADSIVLMDRSGQLLLTTARPFGTPLPKVRATVVLERMLATRKPSVSDLFIGSVSGEPIYTISIPVQHDGSVLYTLNATASPARLLGVLTEQKFSDSWRTAIVDSSGTVVARTHEMSQFVGKKAVPDVLERIRLTNEDSFETRTLEGIPVLTAFSRSAATGWTVALGAPLDELKAGIRQTMALMLAVTLVALGLGLALAWVIGGRIAGAFTALRAPAKALGAGETVSVARSPIREANELGDALLDASRRLDAANRAKADFLSSMSHEFRTPLNAILGFAQLLETASPPPTPSQSASLNQIVKAGWQLLEMVNEVLNLAQIESGKLQASEQPVSLREIMLECQLLVGPLADERAVSLTWPQFDLPCLVLADPSRLQQCLVNLLANAIKYNKPGGSVVVECTQSAPGSIRVGVRDSGAGLAPEQLAQLFQPFNRLGRENLGEKGTGISLVVTKRLVEMMGGAIGVESTVGVGSLFWIELKSTSAP